MIMAIQLLPIGIGIGIGFFHAISAILRKTDSDPEATQILPPSGTLVTVPVYGLLLPVRD